MKLSTALEGLDERGRMLHMYLCGLRVPEELEGAMEYARDEAERINGLAGWLVDKVQRGEIPDADAGFIPDPDGEAIEAAGYQSTIDAGDMVLSLPSLEGVNDRRLIAGMAFMAGVASGKKAWA